MHSFNERHVSTSIPYDFHVIHLISTYSLSFKKHFKPVSAFRKKSVWRVKVAEKKLGVIGPVFIDEMVDINQVVREDAVSENLATLKPPLLLLYLFQRVLSI